MKKKHIAIMGLVAFLVTSAITLGSMGQSYGQESSGLFTEEEVGKMCVEAVFPTITRGAERIELVGPPAGDSQTNEEVQTTEAGITTGQALVDTQSLETPSPATANVNYDKPLVILYHTHATESYQPANAGNFHVMEEAGSVREVGNVLTEELQKLGIQVVYDKTMHDVPSYNQSYSRSLETAKALMTQYPTAVFVIDLHRDAASYAGNVGKTALVNGETAAKYSLVVGQGNPNVNALTIFANTVNAKAEEMYPGFGGHIISKAYKFNQYISDYHLLVEIGNNENNIKEAKTTAKYFAQVMAAVIKDTAQE